ncbi:hypothetical protein BN1723_016757 [Verticillium longisporum]|uniref:Vacuolar-sorting protein SNF8 n=1 Tax=Verticillium longisporum TaxID=100787 RepID=A0A0G4NM10_VERLO|nr:hypothetical protein BN1723_016757 [Verticillium longisporum]
MSRKGIGIGAFDRHRLTSAQYASHGTTLRTTNAAALETQLAVFRSLLQQFAQTHAKDIRSDPSFRAQFARMCTAIGVDPLASSAHSSSSAGDGASSIWAQLLGRPLNRPLNDFYFELAVRVVETCTATRGENGGLIGVREVRERIAKGRPEGAPEVTDDDVLRAVGTLKPLGGAFAVLRVGSKSYIRSVPKELNTDQSAVLEAVQVLGYVSVGMLMANLGARCTATRGENGGLIGVREVRERIAKGRPEGAPEVTNDDVLRAVGTLKPLGGAFAVLKVGSKSYIRSVPKELNTDQSAVLEAVQVLGYVSVGMLMANLGWPRARAVTAVEDLLGEGMLWVDKQSPVEWEYWSPGFMLDEGSHGD